MTDITAYHMSDSTECDCECSGQRFLAYYRDDDQDDGDEESDDEP